MTSCARACVPLVLPPNACFATSEWMPRRGVATQARKEMIHKNHESAWSEKTTKAEHAQKIMDKREGEYGQKKTLRDAIFSHRFVSPEKVEAEPHSPCRAVT